MKKPKRNAAIPSRKESPQERVREAERIYDSPDLEEIESAQESIERERQRGEKAPGDPVVDINVRKPV